MPDQGEETKNELLKAVCAKHIRSLNGIRALSAFIVILYHLNVSPVPGTYGVTVFFVLSGFLITHLLVSEQEKTGQISLKNFYIRRTLRIFPAFYVYALVVIAGRSIAGLAINWPQVATSLTYTGDYYLALVHDVGGSMNHTWSLAVEEQFYLLWPFLFKRFRQKPVALMRALGCTIGVVWIYRLVLSLAGVSADYLYYSFDARLDALGIGCLTALAIHQGYEFGWLLKTKWNALLLAVGLALMPVVGSWQHEHFDSNGVIVNALLPVFAAALIVHSVFYSKSWIYAILNNPVAYYLGLISYSLYLYHPIFARHGSDHASLRILGAIAGSIAVASASYFFVELPFVRLKARFSVAPSSAAKTDADPYTVCGSSVFTDDLAAKPSTGSTLAAADDADFPKRIKVFSTK